MYYTKLLEDIIIEREISYQIIINVIIMKIFIENILKLIKYN